LPRYTVLEILEFRRQTPEVIVMSGFGPNADWLRDIEAAASAEVVVVGSKCFAAVHRVVERVSRKITGNNRTLTQ
jgi:hypothetical protein